MKHSIVLFTLLLILSSCNGDNTKNESEEQIVLTEINDEILSEWQLSAFLLDPGDGSADFVPVTSDRTLTFYDNLEVISKGSICSFDPLDDNDHVGTFDETTKTIRFECINGYKSFGYDMQGEILILDHFCIEPCLSKYIKIN